MATTRGVLPCFVEFGNLLSRGSRCGSLCDAYDRFFASKTCS